jgi:Bacterial Ig domain
MKTLSGSRRFFTPFVFAVSTAFVLSVLAAGAEAAKPAGVGKPLGVGKFTFAIEDPGATMPGESVTTPNVEPGNTKATTFDATGQQTVMLAATTPPAGKGKAKPKTRTDTLQATVSQPQPVGGIPTARGDTYATPVGTPLTVQVSRVSGVLYNDFDTDETTGEDIGNDGLTVKLDSVTKPTNGGTVTFNPDENGKYKGAFTYTPGSSLGDNDNDSFTYQAMDADGHLSNVATVNIHILSDQPDFKIMMNYELGMHCTGFEFSYCCILPPYNSIVAQVVRPQDSLNPFPRLLSGDPAEGLDGLGRETVLRDYDTDGTIHKYYLQYYHDAMPRLEGNMPASDGGHFNSTAGKNLLISAVEGNSMLYWNTPYDSAAPDPITGKLVYGPYANMQNVVQGDGSYTTPTKMGIPGGTDNFANGWLNHFYIYANAQGHPNLEGENASGGSRDADKIRLGVAGMVEYPPDCGPALQPMGPDTSHGLPIGPDRDHPVNPLDPNTCGGASNGNRLTFSGDTGTVVYTQMKVLENLPIMLTSPRIWEALGLPLTPFEDTINFFGEPGAVDEDTIRPFVAMKAQLRKYPSGDAVMGSNGKPVIGFGSAPIDIPNCERCHSAPPYDGTDPNVNAPSYVRRQDGPKKYSGPNGETLEAMEQLEINYWKFIYPSLTTGTDWYARLKSAAISMEVMHDYDHGTDFTDNYPTSRKDEPLNDTLGLPDYKKGIPQNTRMGHEAIICQKCHADNVMAAVKAACKEPLDANGNCRPNALIPPISEAIHRQHAAKSASPPVPPGPITFDDSKGRYGGCQGCHPAHRSDGVLDRYPISKHGANNNAKGDNRLGGGGCFVGRDVHSNPLKDVDGAETPSHLTAVGRWLFNNVAHDTPGDYRGIWCTNCHNQFSQEMWRTEDCNDLIHGDCVNNVRGGESTTGDLTTVISKVNTGRTALGLPSLSMQQVIDYLDPKNPAIAATDPHATHPTMTNQTHAPWSASIPDATVATIEVTPQGAPVGTTDVDGDFSVNILSFCTTLDCVAKINANKRDQSQWRYPANPFINTANRAVAVPFSAADDARDHWLAAGEPHCADCHAAPYTEQSGNITFYPPFNYPAKASLMRYTRGHQGIQCQACHESIHGLYPVGAAMDNTTYAQAAALNADGSHGPLKCGTCHRVDCDGIPIWIGGFTRTFGAVYEKINGSFDNAVGWAHTYTAEADVLNTTCQNCHGLNGEFGSGTVNTNSTPAQWTKVASHTKAFLKHAMNGFTSRQMMDSAETLVLGDVYGSTDGSDGVCLGCHGNFSRWVASCNAEWRQHLAQGRVAESVWARVSKAKTKNGGTCGW